MSGRFGSVYIGSFVNSSGKEEKIAVKTDSRGSYYKRSLVYEMVILSIIGEHPHIVPFVGACTSQYHNERIFLLMEFCSGGNLRTYLQLHSNKFRNYITQNDEISTQKSKDFISLLKLESLNTYHLLTWSYQIADGLCYLATKKIIHNDLAGRNILLDAKRNARICDYGLSRSLEILEPANLMSSVNNSLYIKKFEEPLPPLLAPESRSKHEFSFKSDVWAYGHLLYEIYTLASEAHLHYAHFGKPIFCTEQIHKKIRCCLKRNPEERPHVEKLKLVFENILSNIQELHYIKPETNQRFQSALTNEQYSISTEPFCSDSHQMMIFNNAGYVQVGTLKLDDNMMDSEDV